MDTIAAAEELATQLRTADFGERKVVVTLDPDQHAVAVLAGVGVLVQPPVLEFGVTLGGSTDATWRLVAATGAAGGHLRAWQALDAVLGALAAVADLQRAEPGVLPVVGQQAPLPAYVITLEPLVYDS